MKKKRRAVKRAQLGNDKIESSKDDVKLLKSNKEIEGDINQDKEEKDKKRIDIKSMIIGGFITFIFSLCLFLLTTYFFPMIFDQPKISITRQVFGVLKGTISDTLDVDSDICTVYNARIINADTEEFVDEKAYTFVRGDAYKPGYIDVALGLHNHGKSHAIIDCFTVEVIDYQPIDNTAYTLYKSGEISDPDKFVILYDSVDPLIKRSIAQPAKTSEDGTTNILDYRMFNLRLSPDEHGTYYMKIVFSRYGIYKLDISVYYDYKNTYEKSSSHDYIYVLYDGLTDEQIIEKQQS